MSGTTDDPFVTMLAILNAKIQEQAERISFLEDEGEDLRIRLRTKIEDHAADLFAAQAVRDNTIASLRNDRDYYKDRVNSLLEEREEIRRNDPAFKEKLANFMKEQGEALLLSNQKIECIKQIRMFTGWGLKDAKDFVEQYKDATGRLLAPPTSLPPLSVPHVNDL